ncbi:phage tail assembly chaperone [Qipengyuania flava]|uniref:phage tail assembly chaperone n=1 Tax=Qipengyuania flava TaxID=192812 RepID=UPI001CFDA399|nr:phage tail assembly chaperone [Qipengyuania flava]
MSERFAARALQLAGLAALRLGWTPRVFWNATPSELAASIAPPAPTQLPPTPAGIAALIERDRDG